MTMPVHRIEGDISAATTALLADFLSANPGKVKVIVNSYGGVASEGAAIFAALSERAADVTVHIVGMAASAASLAAMGGGHIVMHHASFIMIHEPRSWLEGTADDMRRAASEMDKFTQVYARAYSSATGNPVEQVAAWMKDETWLTAEEALALNFCDEIDMAGAIEPIAQLDPKRFRAVPPEVLRVARANGRLPEST